MSPSRLRRNARRERRKVVRARLRPKLCDKLMAVWRHACWVWSFFCEHHATPREIMLKEWIATWRYREMLAWVGTIELLTRRLIFAAALALDIVLKPLLPPTGKPRKRRRVLVWPNKPLTWIARFCMFRRQPPEVHYTYHNKRVVPQVMNTTPLARRLEAVRRVLADPDVRIRRFAVKLARIKERNAKANSPRLFKVRRWDTRKLTTRATRSIHTGMRIVMPIIEDRLDAWNAACDPG